MSMRNGEDVLVARLSALAPHLDGEPDPAFRAATRARLVAMAAVRTPAAPPVSAVRRLLLEGMPASARWRTRLTAALAGAALTVTALAAMVAVAEDARPGDALYGLKRGTEQAQLALAGDARGETLLALADTRLDEVRWLVTEGAMALPAAPTLVTETLRTMDAQTAQGVAWLTDRAVTTASPRPLEDLSLWAATQSDELSDLRDDIPAAADDAVADSLGLLADVTTRVAGMESSLACADGPAATSSDDLGPVPTLCPPGTQPGSSGGPPPAPSPAPESPVLPDSATGVVPPPPVASTPSGPGQRAGTPGRIPPPSAPPTVLPTPTPGLPAPAPPGLPAPTPGLPALPPSSLPSRVLPSTSLPPRVAPSTSLPSTPPSPPRLPGTPALPAPGTTSLDGLGVCVPPLVTDGC